MAHELEQKLSQGRHLRSLLLHCFALGSFALTLELKRTMSQSACLGNRVAHKLEQKLPQRCDLRSLFPRCKPQCSLIRRP